MTATDEARRAIAASVAIGPSARLSSAAGSLGEHPLAGPGREGEP